MAAEAEVFSESIIKLPLAGQAGCERPNQLNRISTHQGSQVSEESCLEKEEWVGKESSSRRKETWPCRTKLKCTPRNTFWRCLKGTRAADSHAVIDMHPRGKRGEET